MTTFFELDRILWFVLLTARAGGMIAVAPFLGERIVPSRVKVLLAMVLGLFMLTFAPVAPLETKGVAQLVLLVFGEITVGAAFGFVARLILLAFEMAGHAIAIQIGFGVAQIFDPLTSAPQNLLSRWMWIIGMTLFLGLGGHHHLFRALAATLDLVPPGQGIVSAGAIESLVKLTGTSLATALRIGAPAIGVLLLTSMGLGILARTVPQMNVFIVGFPVKIAAGITAILLSLPYVIEVARREVGELVHRLSSLIALA